MSTFIFGTRQDLRDLVDAAHTRGMYVLLDIIYNHSGNNWFYAANGSARTTMPYRFQPPYPVHGWRSGTGQPKAAIDSLDDGIWPSDFQNLDWYTRAGQIGRWDPEPWEDPLHPDNEFRRGDFFDLKDLNLNRNDTLSAVIRVYQYWIALSDCDGFRIDTVKHVSREASRNFFEPQRSFEDRYIRESMFGGTFGAFETAGCHFFDPDHPAYLRIAAITRIRNARDAAGLALRRGRQYLREISFLGRPFSIPGRGELAAWSRILHQQEVLVALNTHGIEPRGADVTVDATLHPPGSAMRVMYRGDWSEEELRNPPLDQTVPVTQHPGRAAVRIDLPPTGMAILA